MGKMRSGNHNIKGVLDDMNLKWFLTIPLLIGVLVGCGDDDVDQDEVVTNPAPTTETATEDATNTEGQDNAQQNNSSLNFTHFDLDVEYANDLSYNVEYTNNQNQITAELEDEINNVKASGNEAYNKFSSNLESLTFDENTEDQEVLNEVLSAFNLDENYTEFELDVKFENGEVKKYEIRK